MRSRYRGKLTRVLCLGVCLLSGCGGSQETSAAYQKITAAQAKEMMKSGQPYILLDVRTPEEFAEAHIAGAVLIPDYEIKERAKADLPDQSAVIIVYCRSGVRSAQAAHLLVELGYTHVYDMGGILDWPYGTVS